MRGTTQRPINSRECRAITKAEEQRLLAQCRDLERKMKRLKSDQAKDAAAAAEARRVAEVQCDAQRTRDEAAAHEMDRQMGLLVKTDRVQHTATRTTFGTWERDPRLERLQKLEEAARTAMQMDVLRKYQADKRRGAR